MMHRHKTTLQVIYSAVPAVIIVRRDGDRIRVTPVPLSWTLLWGLLDGWLSGFRAHCAGRTRLAWNRLKFKLEDLARQADFQTRLIAPFYKIVFGLFAGASWQRSLAWAILGV
jgi:hypothetical protein